MFFIALLGNIKGKIMKKFKSSKWLWMFGIILFFGSCATSHVSNGGLISKRKHTKGFHLSLNKKAPLGQANVTQNNEDVAMDLNAQLESPVIKSSVTIAPSCTEPKVSVIDESSEYLADQSEHSGSQVATPVFNLGSGSAVQKSMKQESTTEQVVASNKEQSGKSGWVSIPFILILILCFLLPPLAVFLHTNDIGTPFWISVILTLLFWVPGIIYALYVVLT
jgi:uncharacterized membrane protein YqaE (UPF0057 family)